MMIMTTWQGVITIIMAMLGTMLTRFLPFLLFPESKEPPRFIAYLGTVLPYAMTGLLVVYSLKGVHLTSGSHQSCEKPMSLLHTAIMACRHSPYVPFIRTCHGTADSAHGQIRSAGGLTAFLACR